MIVGQTYMYENFMTDFNFGTLAPQRHSVLSSCPDQIFGHMKGKTYIPRSIAERENILYKECPTEISPLRCPIVVVLESPHKSEFSGTKPLGIAHGKTGALFNTNFGALFSRTDIFQDIKTDDIHDVVLVNAVQYQCSLGLPLNKYENKLKRDELWLSCFERQCASDLCDRLAALEPFSVINLCTKGVKNLQLVLHEKLCNFPNYMYGTHPSTWNFDYAYIQHPLKECSNEKIL